MKSNQRKAQITIVLLMVIILIIIFSIMFYVQRSTEQRKSEEKRQALQLSQEKIDPLNEYVTSCLDISAKEGLQLMGEQGGYLYASQGGPISDFHESDYGIKYIEFDNKKVAYAILPPVGKIGPVDSEPPIYPWKTFPEIYDPEGNLVEISTQGLFGRNVMPNLERPFTNSMQAQLEMFVSKNAADCLNLENFEKQNMGIIKGVPVVNVTLTERNVIFELNYPLKIVENATGAEAELNEFAVQYAVRLKKIIEVMEIGTSKDIADAAYNISTNQTAQIQTRVEPSVYRDDDIIIIRDPQSTILGQPYTFVYARKNRPPALVHINSTKNIEQYDINNFTLCGLRFGDSYQGPKITFDQDKEIMIFENQHGDCKDPTLRVPIEAFDPDEDDPVFSVEVDRETVPTYEVPREFMGRTFTFRVKAMDDSSEDYEDVTLKTEVVTPI